MYLCIVAIFVILMVQLIWLNIKINIEIKRLDDKERDIFK